MIGGGPAGAAVALRLARLGHEVTLVERAAFPRAHVRESLPPSILPVLDALGVRERVECAGFLRPGGALVEWDGPRRAAGDAASPPGFQVDRARFDALLLDAARAAGARVLQPARAERPIRQPQGWQVPLREAGTVQARFLIDAAGRHAGLGRRHRRDSPGTAALYGYWYGAGLEGAETRVEAGDEAWYWGAPLPDGSFNAAVFVDRARCAGLKRQERQALYARLLERSALLRACLGGRLAGEVRVCDATAGHDENPIDDTSAKVGEAALAIDPLSSQGVQVSLRTALQASVCVHTIRARPRNGGLAQGFYADQVRAAARRHARLASRHYATAARTRAAGFWHARAAAGADRASATLVPKGAYPNPYARAREGMERGWEGTGGIYPRPGPDQRLAVSPAARLRRKAVLEDDWIVERAALEHPALEAPVAFVAGLEVARLLDTLTAHPTPRRFIQHWSREIPAEKAAAVLEWLWRNGVAVSAGTAP